jgi:sugar O-acyltransferase (sialic acid O-acetyltransferase NeuD family)
MKVIVIGGGGNLKSIVYSNLNNKEVEFIGYTDVNNNGNILGLKYLGHEKEIDLHNTNILISICYLKTPKNRDLRIYLIKSLRQKGANFPNIISPCCSIGSDLHNSIGNLFINSVFVNANVSIGNFNFFNSKVIIEHDVEIGNNNIFSPGVIIGGESKIGNNNFFGIGVIVSDGISICDDVVIGMGSVVIKPITKPGVYFGVPAEIK